MVEEDDDSSDYNSDQDPTSSHLVQTPINHNSVTTLRADAWFIYLEASTGLEGEIRRRGRRLETKLLLLQVFHRQVQ